MLLHSTWTRRPDSVNQDADARVVALSNNFSPDENLKIHAWVQRVDGSGGFAIIETDDVAGLAAGVAIFATEFSFQITPVVEHDQYIASLTTAVTFRKSIVSTTRPVIQPT